MCSSNYKCLSAKRPEATHLPAANWSGFVNGTSLNCADYSELKVEFRILVCIISFLFPFLCHCWAPSPFLQESNLSPTNPRQLFPSTDRIRPLPHHLPHSSMVLPTLHFPPPNTWEDSHLHPPSKTAATMAASGPAPSQARSAQEERIFTLFSTLNLAKRGAWRRLFVFACYTNSCFSVKETGFAISPWKGHLTVYLRSSPLPAPSMK